MNITLIFKSWRMVLRKIQCWTPVYFTAVYYLSAYESTSLAMVLSHLIFFFPFISISWRLITLQYCSGFCHTLTWISHGGTCVPHPDPPSHLPLYPIPLGLPSVPGLSTCLMHPTWAVICFTLDNIHVSMLFSWNIPPSPSPTESKRLFYTSVSLFCSAYRVIINIFLNSIYMC